MGEPLPRRTRVLIFPVTGASGAAGPYCRLENEKAGTFRLRPFIMVRAGGVEPPRAYTHCHLKTARLPFRHARRQWINLHQNPHNLKSACRAAIFRRKIQAARREEGGSSGSFRTTEPSLNSTIFRREIQAARRSSSDSRETDTWGGGWERDGWAYA